MFVLGLMSGTSADGVDAVLAEFIGREDQPIWRILNTAAISYPDSLRRQILEIGQGSPLSSFDWLELAESITEVNFRAAKECDPKGLSKAVGCHGQTAWHRPPSKHARGASLQLLQPQLLAYLLDRVVISDFRAADLVLGGQGAPLAPMLDAAILGKTRGWRAVLNLGGISNVSLIPPIGGPHRFNSVLGWDCGPGNSLLDFAMQRISKGKLFYDQDGEIAAKGIVNEEIIKKWLKENYFQKLPPKSTGREQFGINDFETRLNQISPIPPEDLMATLAAFTAAIVAQDIEKLAARDYIFPIELFVAGGGSLNPVLMKEIVQRTDGIRIIPLDDVGIPIQAREALSFALLAWWNMLSYHSKIYQVTGAIRSSILGSRVYPP